VQDEVTAVVEGESQGVESIEVIEVMKLREDVDADKASAERRSLGRRGGGQASNGSVCAWG
jgi:hypothetical protein